MGIDTIAIQRPATAYFHHIEEEGNIEDANLNKIENGIELCNQIPKKIPCPICENTDYKLFCEYCGGRGKVNYNGHHSEFHTFYATDKENLQKYLFVDGNITFDFEKKRELLEIKKAAEHVQTPTPLLENR